MSYITRFISMMAMLFIIYPILQLGNFLSWNQVKTLLDTNNITRINIIESDSQASLNMNYSHITQNQNRQLIDDIFNFTRAQCNETIVYSNTVYQTKFSRQKNFEEMVVKYLNQSNLKPIDIYYSESIVNVIYSVMYNIIMITIIMNVLNFSVSRLANGMTKNPGKLIKPEDLDVDIKNVIGLNDTKEEVLQYIDYMKNREQYLKMGVEIPRGLLFIGPPGCGKTYLAKCIAAEANVNFISLSGSDFHEMFVGVGAGRMKSLFRVARKNSPSIVFIDEIDSLGQKRSKMVNNSENNSVLNKLLVEMDGFENNDNVLLIGATNRHDTLDDALMRSGRFDRKLVFD
jgi:cell division protease FtsH